MSKLKNYMPPFLKNKIERSNIYLLLFLIFWLVVNLLQAYFTDLHYDEAYYWYYSKDLSWGYFDHPPMVALLAKIGDSIHHSRLGLRLIFILMGTGVIWGIHYLIQDKKNLFWLLTFIVSFPLVSANMAGFLALPDAPLVFFFVMYLIVYRRFIKDPSFINSILFATLCAAMMYSKYHAALIILLTIISNPKLLKQKTFWISSIIAFMLFIPHILWQYNNGFPTFLYHLSDRSGGFRISNITGYVGSQILLAGPLSGIFIIWLAIIFKPSGQFEKTLKYIALGFLMFFTIFCIRGRIEAHWTAVSTVALIIITYKELKNHAKLKKLIPYLILPIVVLIFMSRIFLATNYFAEKLSYQSNFHNYDDWIAEVDSISKNTPVVFFRNYRDPSRYSFSKNKYIPSVPDYNRKFSQYDFNRIDSIYRGKRIFAMSYGEDINWKSKNQRHYYASFIEEYYPYLGLSLKDIKLEKNNDSIFLNATLFNTTTHDFIFCKDSIQRLQLHMNEITHLFEEFSERDSIDPLEEMQFRVFVSPFKAEEKLKLEIGLSSAEMRVYKIRSKNYNIE